MVERNLAKVEVASSRLVSRSSIIKTGKAVAFPVLVSASNGAIAKRLCRGLQSRLGRFDSGSRLQISSSNLRVYNVLIAIVVVVTLRLVFVYDFWWLMADHFCGNATFFKQNAEIIDFKPAG